MNNVHAELSPDENAIYEWQMWVREFGAEGQKKLKNASVLISRAGGVGGAAAYCLAAAGVGRIVLAHGGDIKPSDLNRQLLMTHDALGTSRALSAQRRLRELNPRIELIAIEENITADNAEKLVRLADVVLDAAPLFEERFLLNQYIVALQKPMVECAMYEMETQITTIIPGKTPCLACLYPEFPKAWKRQFPVFGAVAASIGTLGAVEVIKLISGIGKPLAGRMLISDLRDMTFKTVRIRRDPACRVCGAINPSLSQ